MKRYVKRRLPSPTSYELEKLAEYLITRPDLADASIEQVELALKKAGRVIAGEDHFYTAMHAILRVNTIRSRKERTAALNPQWAELRRPRVIATTARALAYLFAGGGTTSEHGEARCAGFTDEDYAAADRLSPDVPAIYDKLDREFFSVDYSGPARTGTASQRASSALGSSAHVMLRVASSFPARSGPLRRVGYGAGGNV